jgi:hypothetical protein
MGCMPLALIDRHLLQSVAEAIDAATADLTLLADLADDRALLTEVLIVLTDLDRTAWQLAALIARHSRA